MLNIQCVAAAVDASLLMGLYERMKVLASHARSPRFRIMFKGEKKFWKIKRAVELKTVETRKTHTQNNAKLKEVEQLDTELLDKLSSASGQGSTI